MSETPHPSPSDRRPDDPPDQTTPDPGPTEASVRRLRAGCRSRTVALAAGRKQQTATAGTLKTQQRKTKTTRSSPTDRGGARPETGPTGGEPPWPQETAPAPAPAVASNGR